MGTAMIFSVRRATRVAGRQRPALISDESGLAAVEFALVAPVFVMLLFGIIIYGIHFGTWIAVNQAATEGARASVAGLDKDERETLAKRTAEAVLAAYGPLLGTAGWEVTATPSTADERLFEVTVSYDPSKPGGNGGWGGDNDLGELLPLPTSTPKATATVSNGGY